MQFIFSLKLINKFVCFCVFFNSIDMVKTNETTVLSAPILFVCVCVFYTWKEFASLFQELVWALILV